MPLTLLVEVTLSMERKNVMESSLNYLLFRMESSYQRVSFQLPSSWCRSFWVERERKSHTIQKPRPISAGQQQWLSVSCLSFFVQLELSSIIISLFCESLRESTTGLLSKSVERKERADNFCCHFANWLQGRFCFFLYVCSFFLPLVLSRLRFFPFHCQQPTLQNMSDRLKRKEKRSLPVLFVCRLNVFLLWWEQQHSFS